MNRILMGIYLAFKMLVIKMKNFIKLLKFTWFLHTFNIFRDGNPKLVLRVIQKFIEIEHSNYSNAIVMGRTLEESATLLSKLIDTYFKQNSAVTLNQITEVLREEFIKREEGANGYSKFKF